MDATFPRRRSSTNRKDGRKWNSAEPATSSRQLVYCEDGDKGFVNVAWADTVPSFYGPVYALADFDAEGNHWAEETLDGNPQF